MKTKHLSAFLILSAVVCIMLTACTIPGISLGCTHENTTIVDAKEATCVEKGYSGDTLCVDCNRVVKMGKELEFTGHSFGEWTILSLPKGGAMGLQQRKCQNCPEFEELTFTTISGKCQSYAELIDVVLDDVIGVDNGNLSFELVTSDVSVASSFDITKTDSGFVLHGTVQSGETVELYYENGALYLLGADGSVALTDIEALLGTPFEEFKAGMDALYTNIEILTSESFKPIKTLVGEIKAAFGEDFDFILSDGYTIGDLDALLTGFEALYTKFAEDFGYITTLEPADDALPTAADYKNLLNAMMAAEEKDGVTIYTLSASPIVDLAEAAYEFITAHSEDTLGDLIYSLFADAIISLNEDLTDIDAVIDFIAQEFPGTIKVSDAVAKYASFAEENGLPGAETIYALIDNIAYKAFGAEIDSAALVSENGDLTLNELVEGIDDIYPEIKSMLADVVIGDIKISDFMSLRSFGDNLRRIIDSVDIRGSVSVSVNADGEVVDFSYDRELWVRPDLDVDEEYEHNLSIKLSITKDDSIVVEVPEDVKAKTEKAE
ncbi:MAG: hypothetical protein IKJ13_04425 [Clostridia bacterium]|nr:hypothetical protein [Clostridia bacterium]